MSSDIRTEDDIYTWELKFEMEAGRAGKIFATGQDTWEHWILNFYLNRLIDNLISTPVERRRISLTWFRVQGIKAECIHIGDVVVMLTHWL
jgi:hypothetical protein